MDALAPIALALFALAAAGALAVRLGRQGALGWLDTGVLFSAILALPPYALGWLDAFTAKNVAAASFGTSALALGLTLLTSKSRERTARAVGDRFVRAVFAPWFFVREARTRGAWVAALAVAITSLVWLWTTLLGWLFPSSGWDGIWYHDTIVGCTIQNRGFGWVDLPIEHALINGYPRLAETMAAFFVVLADDRFLEIAPTLTWPFVAVAAAVLASWLTASWEVRVAAACAFALIPALALQLRSSYIDVPATFFLVAAIAYVTRPRLRAADLWLAGLACGMGIATKATGLVQVPLLAAVVLARVAPRPRLATTGAVLGAAALILAIGAPTYLRNWQHEANPIWPIARDIESLDLHFPGPVRELMGNPSPAEWLRNTYGEPKWEEYHHDVRPHGYGHALPLVLPVLLVSALVLALYGDRKRRRPPVATTLWLLLVAVGIGLVTPPVWWGRFGASVLACLLAIGVAWLAWAPRGVGRATLAFVLIVHLATLGWAKPGWHATPTEALALLRRAPVERATFPVGPLFGAPETLRAFEDEVGPGDVVVWTRPNGFPSFAWNREMSNRAVYVERVDEATLERLGARWVIVERGSMGARTLDRSARFQSVGQITDLLVGYRRVD